MDLRERVYRSLVQHLVTRNITCLRTGNVLDVRTCVVFVDSNDEPSIVMSPEGYLDMVETQPDALERLAENGLRPDPDTIPKGD